MTSSWTAYNELAWTDKLLADSGDYEDEVMIYVDLINNAAAEPPRTLLHLGCGAGGHDGIFKRHFSVTGADISRGMLNIARTDHPDIEYLEDDMRTLRLGRQFDAVIIPDSIDYITSLNDLRKTIQTAALHLNPGGAFLVTAKTRETFKCNNFAYTGEKNGVHVTLLENNYVNPDHPDIYEAYLVYLIRHQGELTVHTDHHMLGLFSLTEWEQIFREAELDMSRTPLDGLYDSYILNDGEYPLIIFSGTKLNFG